MRKNRLIFTLLFAGLIGGITSAQSGGNFIIKDATLEGSGHASSGGNFVTEIRLGQGLAGQSMSGGEFAVGGGIFPSPPQPPPPPVTPPAAPSNLIAGSTSMTSIMLTWTDNALDENSFDVERCDGKGRCRVFNVIATQGANSMSFLDTGLEPATQYTYRVRAVNAAGNSGYSNTAKARTPKR